MTRAPWVLPKPSRAFPAGNVDGRLDDAGLAAGQPADAGGVDGLARRGQRAAAGEVRRSPASGRTRSPPARTTSPTRPGTTGFYDDLVVAGARHRRSTRDEGIRAGLERREAGQAEAVVPQGRHHHRRQRLAAQRRRLRRAARLGGGGRPASGRSPSPGSPAAARTRSSRSCSATPRSRPPSRRCARAGIGWSDVGAVELNEAFAVQSLACLDAWEHRPRDRQHQRRRDRDRPPAGRLRRPDPRHAGQGAARGRPPLGRGRDLHRRRPGPRRRAGERRR